MLPLGGSTSHAIILRTTDAVRLNDATRLWDEYSGLSGLLTQDGYTYDPDTDKYYYGRTRRPVSDSQLRAAVKRVSDAQALEMRKATQQLIAGAIFLNAWYQEMNDLMYALYKTIWVLSIGGFAFDDDLQRNLFYAYILFSFDRLDAFAYQLRAGVYPLNGQAMNRAGLYGKLGNALWQDEILDGQIAAGMREAKNILGPTEDHCHDSPDRPGCLETARQGWMPIRDMPRVGERTCYSNCLCRIIYR